MSKTYRFDSGSFEYYGGQDAYAPECLDCGTELYPNEIEFGICSECDAEYHDENYDDGLIEDEVIDENDTEALAWLSSSDQ